MITLLAFAIASAVAQTSVTFTNCTTTAANTVVCAAAKPPDPPNPPSTTCKDAGYSVIGPVTVGSTPQTGTTGLPDTGAWIFSMTIPAGTPDSTQNGSLTITNNGGNTYWRQCVISPSQCDFNNPAPMDACNNTPTCSVQFRVKAAGGTGGGVANLVPGNTYFTSCRNWSSFIPGGTCGTGATCSTIYSYQPAH